MDQPSFDPLETACLHDRALHAAGRLREQAIADMWSELDAALDRAMGSAERAAQRLTYRLQRRHRAPLEPAHPGPGA